MGKIFVSEHPLIKHKIAMLRNKDTGSKEFREIVTEIAMLLFYEATRDLELVDVDVETPIATAHCKMIAKKIAVVPILRAGVGMSDGLLSVVPNAKVGHIGLYRDPVTFESVEYYCKLPSDIAERDVFLVDPMLATGVTADAAIHFLNERGVKNINFLTILSAPEGVKVIQEKHPDVNIFSAAMDPGLNDHKYIVPGLGDAGDRIFGTK